MVLGLTRHRRNRRRPRPLQSRIGIVITRGARISATLRGVLVDAHRVCMSLCFAPVRLSSAVLFIASRLLLRG